jgi:hypothetical protein
VAERTFDALVARAVERFVQSAVVVDDRAYMGVPSEPTKLVTPSPEAEALALAQDVANSTQAPNGEQTADPANTPLDAKEIVDAFAARGVVCGVLRPEPGEANELTRIAPKAIRHSDLLILDWHLQGDDGEAAIALLKQVLEDAGDALRLVAIYTGEPKLDAVVRKLIEELGAESIDDFSVHIGALRIIVLGKAVEGDDSSGCIAERDLPERLMQQFANLADGLVRAAALSALGALRGATYRLLAGLDRPLDLGYVGQRALVFPSAEAEDDLLGMLVSELRAIVEDDVDTRACADSEAVALWLRREAAAGRAGAFSPKALTAMVEADLSNSESLQELKGRHTELNPLKKPKENEGVTHHFTNEATVAISADEQFAMRMTLKLVYDRPERLLSLGTIVKSGNGRYWLCVQPICDSLRITGKRRYPFVPLSVAVSRFQYVITDGDDIVHLGLTRKPSAIQHWTFQANRHARAVIAKGDAQCFVTTSGTRFRWVAQLNEGHALRAAQEIGLEQSRVGLSESDWLRRMAK